MIVNDMSEVNINAQLVKAGSALNRVKERSAEFTNGCICRTLREDLLLEITKLAGEGKFDYLLVESTGISEPLPVAGTFTFADESGNSLSDKPTLDTLVTVVDAVAFLKEYAAAGGASRIQPAGFGGLPFPTKIGRRIRKRLRPSKKAGGNHTVTGSNKWSSSAFGWIAKSSPEN